MVSPVKWATGGTAPLGCSERLLGGILGYCDTRAVAFPSATVMNISPP